MFTGLIDEIGTITRVVSTDAGRELSIRCGYGELTVGESVAVNGACLTVLESGDGRFTVAAVATTVLRTNIGIWQAGRRVNLERAMRLGDRLGGHLVQGHVDGVGVVTSVELQGEATIAELTLPGELRGAMVPRGSIALDGVSLTVLDVPAEDVVRVSLIPYTVAHTTWSTVGVGDGVHVEADMIAKYVRQWVAPYLDAADVRLR